MAFKTCTHVKADGLRCGSPALRGEFFCYFHHHSADHRPRTQARVVQIPFPENAAAIQVGIHNIMLAIIDRRIDERRAQQLLWALQIAAGQGRQLPFDNNLLMSRTVTQLPDYELEELEQKEEERRTLEQLRAGRSAPAPDPSTSQPSDVPMPQSPDCPITGSPDGSILSASSASSAPSAVPPFNHPIVKSSNHQIQQTAVIPTGAALRGGVEGPAFPPPQQSAAGTTKPRSRNSKLETRNSIDFEAETRRALSGDWRATDRLFRASGLIPTQNSD